MSELDNEKKQHLILVNKLYVDELTDQNLTFPKIILFTQIKECGLIQLFFLVHQKVDLFLLSRRFPRTVVTRSLKFSPDSSGVIPQRFV